MRQTLIEKIARRILEELKEAGFEKNINFDNTDVSAIVRNIVDKSGTHPGDRRELYSRAIGKIKQDFRIEPKIEVAAKKIRNELKILKRLEEIYSKEKRTKEKILNTIAYPIFRELAIYSRDGRDEAELFKKVIEKIKSDLKEEQIREKEMKQEDRQMNIITENIEATAETHNNIPNKPAKEEREEPKKRPPIQELLPPFSTFK